jgi:hypothetical protein
MSSHPSASVRGGRGATVRDGARRAARGQGVGRPRRRWGFAGAALAARLTESGRPTVLLLQAGGPDQDANLRIPAAGSTLFRTGLVHQP